MSKKLAKVFHAELFGKRAEKFDRLNESDFESIEWKELEGKDPYYFFVPKDFELEEEYQKGFGITDLIHEYNTGIQTKNDALAVTFTPEEVKENVRRFQELSIDELRQVFPERKESSGWNFKNAKDDLLKSEVSFCKILYRPFDVRHTVYTGKSSGFVGRPRSKTMKHMVAGENVGLVTLRINGEGDEFVILASENLVEKGSLPRGNYSLFPLYLYHDDGTRTANLDLDIIKQIEEKLGMVFDGRSVLPYTPTKDAQTNEKTFSPEDILDYIYAVLHSPSYRERYKEFLKIDFPRIPYPQDKKNFDALVALGRELRGLHLLESEKVSDFITIFPESGNNTIEKGYPKYEDGNVHINESQHFGNVPEVAWNFYIGGYQPAQKWLKDRRGRTLTSEDIQHYQKVIISLTETDRIMKEIGDIK